MRHDEGPGKAWAFVVSDVFAGQHFDKGDETWQMIGPLKDVIAFFEKSISLTPPWSSAVVAMYRTLFQEMDT